MYVVNENRQTILIMGHRIKGRGVTYIRHATVMLTRPLFRDRFVTGSFKVFQDRIKAERYRDYLVKYAHLDMTKAQLQAFNLLSKYFVMPTEEFIEKLRVKDGLKFTHWCVALGMDCFISGVKYTPEFLAALATVKGVEIERSAPEAEEAVEEPKKVNERVEVKDAPVDQDEEQEISVEEEAPVTEAVEETAVEEEVVEEETVEEETAVEETVEEETVEEEEVSEDVAIDSMTIPEIKKFIKEYYPEFSPAKSWTKAVLIKNLKEHIAQENK